MKHIFYVVLFFVFASSITFGQNVWQPINNGLGTDTLIRAIVVGSGGNIYIGTSEGGYQSTDHGSLWTSLIPPGSITVQSLAIDPSHIYAGTDHGMALSTDNGTNWSPINNGFPDALVLAIAINDSGHVIAGSDVDGLYRSKDFGGNWSQLTNGLTSPNITVAANYGGRTLFVGTDGSGMYLSTDNGDSWTQSNSGLSDLLLRAITIKKNGDIFIGTNTGGVFRSVDIGQTWSPVNTNLTTSYVVSLLAHPNGTMYAGTSGGGVFRSSDNGNNWSAVNAGLTNLFVYALGLDSSGYIYAGTAGGGMYRTILPLTAVDQPKAKAPIAFSLHQNYPNPFNPSTEIKFDVVRSGVVTLKVFDLLGREVATLVNEQLVPGSYSRSWKADALSSGVYFYRLVAGQFVVTKKMVLMR